MPGRVCTKKINVNATTQCGGYWLYGARDWIVGHVGILNRTTHAGWGTHAISVGAVVTCHICLPDRT